MVRNVATCSFMSQAKCEFIGPGLKATVESIDNRADFKVYMQNYAFAHGGQAYRGPRREGPAEEGFVSRDLLPCTISVKMRISCQLQLPPLPSYADRMYSNSQAAGSSNSSGHIVAVAPTLQAPDRPQAHPTFGVDLAEQMNRDQVEIPMVVEKCCAAIEKYGLRSQGIYRISGTQTKVWKLKERLDKGSSMRVVTLHNHNLTCL